MPSCNERKRGNSQGNEHLWIWGQKKAKHASSYEHLCEHGKGKKKKKSSLKKVGQTCLACREKERKHQTYKKGTVWLFFLILVLCEWPSGTCVLFYEYHVPNGTKIAPAGTVIRELFYRP